MKPFPASVAQFSKNGVPYEAGDTLRQPDLARTLERIARQGPAGFYEGETAQLIDKEMRAHGGLVTREALKAYKAVKRRARAGSYRGYEVICGAAAERRRRRAHRDAQPARGLRSRRERVRIGASDSPDRGVDAPRLRRSRAAHRRSRTSTPTMPVARLISKPYADELRRDDRSEDARLFRHPRASPGGMRATRRRTCRSSTRNAMRCR